MSQGMPPVSQPPPWGYQPPPPPPSNPNHSLRNFVLVVLALILAFFGVRALVAPDEVEPVAASAGDAVVLGSEKGDLEASMPQVIGSIEGFWKATYPNVYRGRFTPLAEGWQPKSPLSKPYSCQGERLRYDDVQGNAFYCGGSSDDYIAWDAKELFPELNREYGSAAPAIVLAHEMGHAIQARADVRAPSVVIELQADCFAGAWSRAAEAGDGSVTIDSGALDAGVAAMLSLSDQPGDSRRSPDAHGLGFDRVSAFSEGYEEGAARCAEYPRNRPLITESRFSTREEQATGGNISYEEMLQSFIPELDDFWAKNLPALATGATWSDVKPNPVPSKPLPSCEGKDDDAEADMAYCPSSNSAAWAEDVVSKFHEEVGDLLTGSVLSDMWSEAAQSQAGLETDSDDASIQRDCLSGAFYQSLAGEGVLSPGDLDEALKTMILTQSSSESNSVTLFQRSNAMRDGFTGGVSACTA